MWRQVGLLLNRVQRARRPFCSKESDFIILDPRQSGLVKDAPHWKSLKRASRRPPLPENLPVTIPPKIGVPIFEAIDTLKPETKDLTPSMYERVKHDLVHGFVKAQLDEYLKHTSLPKSLYFYSRKAVKAEAIIKQVWGCKVVDSDFSAFVENIIELREHEFALVLGNDAQMLREWTKSGARLSIHPSKRQIIVQSLPQTFQWIEARLNSFLDNISSHLIDVSGISKYIDLRSFPAQLLAIQKLSSTYFIFPENSTDTLDTIAALSANGSQNVQLAKRMLLQLCAPVMNAKWQPKSIYYDVNADDCRLAPVLENKAFMWYDRIVNWARYEKVKHKNDDFSTDMVQLKRMQQPEFSLDTIEAGESSLKSQLPKIIEQLKQENKTLPQNAITTLSLTPGYVLHECKDELIPNNGMRKMFCSEVPYVARFASTLSFYNDDIPVETEVDVDTEKVADSDAGNESPETDMWSLVAQRETQEGTVYESNISKEQQNTTKIQMRFVPNPSLENCNDYPPIEVWANVPPASLKSNTDLKLNEVPQIYAVHTEATALVSLPNMPTDLKVSLSHSSELEMTEKMHTYFMEECTFSKLHPQKVPYELPVEINGKEVPYLYVSAAYSTIAELDLRNQLVVFSNTIGGKLGGYYTEASVVSCTTEGDDTAIDTQSMVEAAVDFVNSPQKA